MDSKELDKSRAEFEAWYARRHPEPVHKNSTWAHASMCDDWEVWCAARAGSAAPAGQQAEPIYQVWDMGSGGWGDTTRNHYDYTPDQHRRIVYLAPVSAAPAAAVQPGEQDARDAERFRWIENNCRTTGGGHGFTLTCYVPVDEEDIGCAIDSVLAAATPEQSDTTKGQA